MAERQMGGPILGPRVCACSLPVGYSFRLNSSLDLACRQASYLTMKNTEAQKGQVAYRRLQWPMEP